MGKWFEVRVAAYKTCLVEIDPDDFDNDKEEMRKSAELTAMTEAFSFCDTVETTDATLIADDEVVIDAAKSRADAVYAL